MTTNTTPQSMAGLYARVLGERWEELPEPLRRLHAAGQPVRATGQFRVQRGNWFCRRLASLARLPREGNAVPMQLIVTTDGEHEEWSRSFAGRPLVSRQWKHADGFLAEHMGFLVLPFRLETQDGSLHYENDGATFRMGPIRVPIPRWMAPRVTARETLDDHRIAVLVETRLPFLGLLVSYEGTITVEECEQC